MFDRSKTLTELEGDDWGKPFFASHLVLTCHQMRHKPIIALTDDELRVAIGQQFSLPVLVPLALERLEQNPVLRADFYEGDLLNAVLMVNPEFWTEHPDFWQRANGIAEIFWSRVGEIDPSWHDTIEPDVRQNYARFVQRKP